MMSVIFIFFCKDTVHVSLQKSVVFTSHLTPFVQFL
jgi:hypothetical protein